MSRERQLGDGRIDARVRRAGPWLGHIDEYRFAVTQFCRYPLPLAGLGLTGVDDAEGIAEAAVLVGEKAQRSHVDAHVADATWSPIRWRCARLRPSRRGRRPACRRIRRWRLHRCRRAAGCEGIPGRTLPDRWNR